MLSATITRNDNGIRAWALESQPSLRNFTRYLHGADLFTVSCKGTCFELYHSFITVEVGTAPVGSARDRIHYYAPLMVRSL